MCHDGKGNVPHSLFTFIDVLLKSMWDRSCDQSDNSESRRELVGSKHEDSQDSLQHSSRASQCFCSLLRVDARHGSARVYFHLV